MPSHHRHIGTLRVLVLTTLLVGLIAVGQSPAQAATRSDCNGAVCEEVTFSGSTVTDWFASANPGLGYHCGTARFFVNGSLYSQEYVCGSGWLTADANTPLYNAAGKRLCAAFSGQSGYACVTI